MPEPGKRATRRATRIRPYPCLIRVTALSAGPGARVKNSVKGKALRRMAEERGRALNRITPLQRVTPF